MWRLHIHKVNSRTFVMTTKSNSALMCKISSNMGGEDVCKKITKSFDLVVPGLLCKNCAELMTAVYINVEQLVRKHNIVTVNGR